MTVAIAPRTIYDGRDLSSGYTWDVDLTNSYFYGCNLSGVDLSQVTSFKGCEFYWCNMTGTKFTGLDLRNLNFGSGPTLQWCNLTSADFTNANLSYVNLTGNTLTGVIISGATITGTVGLIGVGAINITGPPVAGYNTWFHADSLATTTPVPQLTDSTANANHATQATPANRGAYAASAVNGKAAVTFDGASTYYVTPSLITGSFFAVINHTDGATFVGACRPFDANNTSGWGFYGLTASYGCQGALDTAHFWINGVVGTTSLDATPLVNYRVISATMTPVTSAVTVGCNSSPSQFLLGHVAEYIIYPTALSTGNRQSVETYLKTKYGL